MTEISNALGTSQRLDADTYSDLIVRTSFWLLLSLLASLGLRTTRDPNAPCSRHAVDDADGVLMPWRSDRRCSRLYSYGLYSYGVLMPWRSDRRCSRFNARSRLEVNR